MGDTIRPIDEGGAVRPMPTPYSDVQYTPQDFGAGMGDALQGAGTLAAHIAKKAKDEADTAQVMDAIAQSKGALNDVILDPEKGYASTKGNDAIVQRSDFMERFNKAVDDAGATLTNDDQKRAFRQHEITIRETAALHAVSHEAVQQEDLGKAKYQGAADQTMRTLQAVVSDPVQLAKQLDDLHMLATAEGARRFGTNAPPEAIASMVGPEMQRGALFGMEAALGTQDPKTAQDALQQLSPYLGNHERFYAAAVQRMGATRITNLQASRIVGAGMTQVALPGGQTIGRLDDGAVLAELAKLPQDDPLRDDIEKEVAKRQGAYGRAWEHSVAQVVAASQTEGDPKALGNFDISKVSPARREWLNQNAPDELIKLRQLDNREQRATTHLDAVQQKADSAENYSAALADMSDPVKWASTYAKMSPAQLTSQLLDEGQYPGGLTAADRTKALQFFNARTHDFDKLDERPEKIIKDQIGEALKNPIRQKRFETANMGMLLNETSAFMAQEKAAGRKVDSNAIRDFVNGKLQKVDSGHIYIPDRRQIELDVEQAAKAGPQAAAATPVAAPAPAKGRVTVRDSSGKAFTLPPEQVDAFLASPQGKGFSR